MRVPAGYLLDPQATCVLRSPRWLRPVTTDVPRRPGGSPRCGGGGPLQEQLHGSLEGFHSLSSDEGQTWMGFRIPALHSSHPRF